MRAPHTRKGLRMNKIATATENSKNSKIGLASATSAAQESCDDTCPFLRNGCYAEAGFQGMYVTSKLNREATKNESTFEDIARAEASEIDTLTGKRDLRLHVVGDGKTDKVARILGAAATRFKSKFGRAVWTYTHAWRTVRRASWGKDVSILASCENVQHIVAARQRGYATILVMQKFLSEKLFVLDGEKILPCPHTVHENRRKAGLPHKAITCVSCKLCFKDTFLRENGITIGLESHGGAVKKVNQTLIQIGGAA